MTKLTKTELQLAALRGAISGLDKFFDGILFGAGFWLIGKLMLNAAGGLAGL